MLSRRISWLSRGLKRTARRRFTFPLTSLRRIDLVITELAVIAPGEDGLVLRELAPGVSLDDVLEPG